MNRIASLFSVPARGVALCLLAALGACDREVVDFGEPRRLPADKRPTVWDASEKARLGLPDIGAARADDGDADGGKQVVADLPEGWTELPANPARFRNAVWQVTNQPDTDCYLTLGVGGGVQGNLRRWYVDQFGNAEVPAIEALPVIEMMGRTGRLAEIEGTFAGKAGWMALIAFFHKGQQVTSLKFTGPAKTVQANRQKFLGLAKSLRTGSKSSDPGAPVIPRGATVPDGHPGGIPAGTTDPSGAQHGGGAGGYAADVPADWQPKAGSGKALHYTFGSAGEVYVSSIGGTVKAACDIWRGEVTSQGVQFGPLSQEEFDALPKMTMLGGEAVRMEVAGDYRGMVGPSIPNARLLIGARGEGGAILFAKMIGPADEVLAQRDAFVKFCESMRQQ